jgi:hypothetical protein
MRNEKEEKKYLADCEHSAPQKTDRGVGGPRASIFEQHFARAKGACLRKEKFET